ncbi:hypothetical protein [[Ruminococcus] torques]
MKKPPHCITNDKRIPSRSDSQCYVAALKFKTHVSLADWLTFQSYIYVLI